MLESITASINPLPDLGFQLRQRNGAVFQNLVMEFTDIEFLAEFRLSPTRREVKSERHQAVSWFQTGGRRIITL